MQALYDRKNETITGDTLRAFLRTNEGQSNEGEDKNRSGTSIGRGEVFWNKD